MIDAVKASSAYKDIFAAEGANGSTNLNKASFKAVLSDMQNNAQPVRNDNVVVELVSEGVKNVFSTVGHAEELSKKAIVGEANIMDVTVALNEADLKLKEIQIIRDRLVSALNDIIKTPI
jgi:flagellar hook-basal body complex protein FliE